MFPNYDSAKKEAISEISFRGRLAHSCEKEFNESVKNSNIEKLANDIKQIHAQRNTMDEDTFIQEVEVLEEQRGKLKRRMLGNIRFVGELYKKKLLNTETMHDCINELLGAPGQWKESHDDADLELLCRFLKTVGESLEAKSSKSKNKPELAQKFNQYFNRLLSLTKDKNINSRLRFSIEEVIELRNNSWQARHETEGPKKIAEIHKDVQAEQMKQQQAQQMQMSGGGYGKGGTSVPGTGTRILTKGGSDDVRNRGQGGGRNVSGDSHSGRGLNKMGSGGRGGGSAGLSPKDAHGATRQLVTKSTTAPAPIVTTTASVALPSASPKTPITFTNESVRRKVHSTVDEYLHGEDINEIRVMVEEAAVHVGYLLLDIIDTYLNMKKGAKEDRLLHILDDVALIKMFVYQSSMIEIALEMCEPLKALVSTSVDVLQVRKHSVRVDLALTSPLDPKYVKLNADF
jgi:hypothetical protein